MRKKTKIFAILLLALTLCFSVTFLACKKDNEETVDSTVQIKLNVSELRLRIYSQYTLSVKTNGDYQLTFASEDNSIATVSNEGVITAEKVGQTKINVSYDGVVATCVLTVYETTEIPTFTIFGVDDSRTIRLLPSQTYKVTPDVEYAGEKVVASVVMESSNESIATVANDGTITAIKQGTVTVNCSATYKKWTVSTSFNVDVTLDTAVVLSKYNSVVYVSNIAGQNTTDEISKAEVYVDGILLDNQPTIEWSSEDQTVATVQNGVISAVAVGKTQVIASCTIDGKVYGASVNVTVKQPSLESATGFAVEDGVLTWDEVDYADGYRITANRVEADVADNEYDVSNLFGKVEFTVVPYSNNDQIIDGEKVKYNYEFYSGLITEKVLVSSPTAEGSTVTKVGEYDGQDVYNVTGKTTGFEVGTGPMFKLIFMTPFMESRVNSAGKQPFLDAQPIVSNDLDYFDFQEVSITFWAYSLDGDVTFTLANSSGNPGYVSGATIHGTVDVSENTWTKVTLNLNKDLFKLNHNLYAGIFASKEFYFTDIRMSKLDYDDGSDFTDLSFYAGMEFFEVIEEMPSTVPQVTDQTFATFDSNMNVLLDAYSKLSSDRLENMDDSVKNKFQTLCLEYVNNVIPSLPSETELTCYDGEMINKAHSAYQNLSTQNKENVLSADHLLAIKTTYDRKFIVAFDTLSPWFNTITDAYKRVDLGVNSYYATVNYSLDNSYYNTYGTLTKAIVLPGKTNDAGDMSNNMHTVFDANKIKQLLEDNPDVMEVRFSILSQKTSWDMNKIGSKNKDERVYASIPVSAGSWSEIVISREDGLTTNGALRRASMSLDGEQTVYFTNLYLVRSEIAPIIDKISALPEVSEVGMYNGNAIYHAYREYMKLPESFRAQVTNAQKLLSVKEVYDQSFGLVFEGENSWISPASTGLYAATSTRDVIVDETYGKVVRYVVDKKSDDVANSHNFRVHFNSLKTFLEANEQVTEVKFKVFTTKTTSEYMLNGSYFRLEANTWTELTLSRENVLSKDSQTFSIGSLTSTDSQTIMFTNFYYEIG